MWTCPESGRISPAITESRVDFPDPDRPTRLVVWPWGKASSTWLRTSSWEGPLPYDFDTATRRTNGCPEVGITLAPSQRGSPRRLAMARQSAPIAKALDHHRRVPMQEW